MAKNIFKSAFQNKHVKRIGKIFIVSILFLFGIGIGLNNNPKYLAWAEQQNEIKTRVAKESAKIQADANKKIDEATKTANENADKKVSKANDEADTKMKEAEQKASTKQPEVNTVEKVVEKKVQFVHQDCESIIQQYNYLLKLIDVGADNTLDVRSSVSIAHNNYMKTMARNCLNNQSYSPTGTIGGKANQQLWNNW